MIKRIHVSQPADWDMMRLRVLFLKILVEVDITVTGVYSPEKMVTLMV